jgi:glutaredoxin-like protein
MENLLNPEVSQQIKEYLSPMQKKITLVLFTDGQCNTCQETEQLLSEVSQLTDKITVVQKDLDSKEAKDYDVTMTPSFVILDDQDQYKGVKFNGIPAGHEINSFLSALTDMSGDMSSASFGFDDSVKARLDKLDRKVNIKVFVTLSCPHCPGAVSKAHRLAMSHPMIEGEMIEAQTFNELSNKFNVSGVPKIIIDDTRELVGNQPIEAFLKEIEALA